MKHFLASLSLAAVLLCSGLAHATCGHATAGATALTIIPANDMPRHYLSVQNTGASNNVQVQIGAAATATDFNLLPTASTNHANNELVLQAPAQGNALLPSGIVSVISASGTTVSWCDY